jgi:phosphatidate phosphatase APP1
MRYLGLAAMMFLLGACIPYHTRDAPQVAGRVVSRATGKPVVGASVSMTSRTTPEGQGRTVHTQTDARGYFSLPAIEHWFVAPLSEGYVDGEGTLTVEAPGYQPHREKRMANEQSLVIPLVPKT